MCKKKILGFAPKKDLHLPIPDFGFKKKITKTTFSLRETQLKCLIIAKLIDNFAAYYFNNLYLKYTCRS